MRKLVSIQKISNVTPIFNADLIEVITINGWKIVVKKDDNFKIGDNVVYFEIDSALPLMDERFSFLKQETKKIDGIDYHVLRTKKMRGQVSQGLVLPLNKFPEFNDYKNIKIDENSEVGLGELIGVIKYEEETPENLKEIAVGMFPSHTNSTSIERVQNISFYDFKKMILNFNDNNPKFTATLKLNGYSSTYFFKNGEWGGCSRNIQFDLTKVDKKNIYIDTFKKIIEPKFQNKELPNFNFAIQGEIIGEKVMKNFEKIIGNDLYVFKIFNIDKYEILSRKETKEFCEKYNLNYINEIELEKDNFKDIVGTSDYDEVLKIVLSNSEMNFVEEQKVNLAINKIQEYFLENANGNSMNHQKREGIVIYFENGDVYKAISNKHLLKN